MARKSWFKTDIAEEFVTGIIHIFHERSEKQKTVEFDLNSYLWTLRKKAQKLPCPSKEQLWELGVRQLYYKFEWEKNKPQDLQRVRNYLETDAYIVGHQPSCGLCGRYFFKVRDFFEDLGALVFLEVADEDSYPEYMFLEGYYIFKEDLMRKIEEGKGERSWYEFYLDRNRNQ